MCLISTVYISINVSCIYCLYIKKRVQYLLSIYLETCLVYTVYISRNVSCIHCLYIQERVQYLLYIYPETCLISFVYISRNVFQHILSIYLGTCLISTVYICKTVSISIYCLYILKLVQYLLSIYLETCLVSTVYIFRNLSSIYCLYIQFVYILNQNIQISRITLKIPEVFFHVEVIFLSLFYGLDTLTQKLEIIHFLTTYEFFLTVQNRKFLKLIVKF